MLMNLQIFLHPSQFSFESYPIDIVMYYDVYAIDVPLPKQLNYYLKNQDMNKIFYTSDGYTISFYHYLLSIIIGFPIQ